MIATLITLLIGVWIGTNFGFIIAGLMGRADDGEEMSD
jgi:ABC-type nitrate/sulfonate/bicarbonate transport system permease component